MTNIRKQICAALTIGLLLSCYSISWAQNQNGILIFPFKINDNTEQPVLKKMISDMLFSRLSANKCMIVKDYRSLNSMSNKTLNIDHSKKFAKDNKLTQVLIGSVSIFGGQYSFDSQIWKLNDQKPYFTHSVMASSKNDVIPKINEMSLAIQKVICRDDPILEKQKNRTGSFIHTVFPELDYQIHSIAIANINQDRHPKMIAAGKNSIYLFDFLTDSLDLIGQYNADHNVKIIWLDAADINNDQKTEIYVTAMHKLDGHLVSFVLVWVNDTFRVILKNEPYYFRIFRRFDHTVHLIGQKQTLEHFFSKKICLLQYHQNHLIVNKMQFIPPDSHFVSFHQGKFVGPNKSYVVIRDNNRLEILDESFRSRWVSETLYAESKKILILPNRASRKAPHENEKYMYLNQRIHVDDVDQDHIDEIIVSQQNTSSGGRLFQRYRQFSSGIITCLKWNGLGMVPLWKTPKINGYISDYFWFDKTGQKDMCIAVVVVSKKSFFKSEASRILLFEYQHLLQGEPFNMH
jgi:hypothetical protein